MPPPADSAAVLFPGALGDFICFLPTLFALRDRHGGRFLLVAKAELLDLVEFPKLTTASIDRREISDLFRVGSDLAPETKALFSGYDSIYSWTGFGNADVARRLAAASGGRVHMCHARGMLPGEHAVDYYARSVGCRHRAMPAAAIRQDQGWLATMTLTSPALVLHAGSGSASKNWQGFDEITQHWRAHHEYTIVHLVGPAESHVGPQAAGVITAAGLSLPQVAALLHPSALYLGNDSGISHLAGAVGARGVVLFGPSDPTTWAPRSERLRIMHAPTPCMQCPGAFCVHRLPVASVVAALEAQRSLLVQP